VSESQTLLLGFIAGVTILIGLPLGRMRAPRPGLRQFLNALAIGILLFLIWDVLVHAFEPIDTALGRLHDGSAGIGPVLGYAALFFLGLTVGMMSLVYYEAWLARQRKPRNFGPGTMAPGELTAAKTGIAGWSTARRMSLLIEGFGIVAPLAAEGDRPSWGFLLLMGLIGGGPTFLGTAVGSQFTSEAMSVIFLTLAAGSILYVVIQLLGVAHKNGRKELLYWGVLLGLAAGFVTDMVVTAGGA